MAKNPRRAQRAQSGAVGGPSTGAGMNYQVDFAVFQSLEKISEALVNPFEQAIITMEPRVLTAHLGLITNWDVRVSPPDTVTEAKLRPKRDEIIEWLDRVEQGGKQCGDRHFQLFYGRGAAPLLNAIERLCRIATETGGNGEAFRSLVQIERTPEVDTVLEHLPSEPHRSLSRSRVVPFDPNGLSLDIQFRLRHLLPQQDQRRLYDLLFSKFHKGIERRVTFKVRDLIAEAERAGIEFCPPPPFELRGLDPLVSGAIAVLQESEIGLPPVALAAGLNCTVDNMNGRLSQYVESGLILRDGDLWALAPFMHRRAVHARDSNCIGRALNQLLDFIKENKRNVGGRSQVRNAIALAKVCQVDHAELVSSLLKRLDKLLKQTGNKRLVLEVANLSIVAARRTSPRTEMQAKGEAVALVCGRSWVNQRVNLLGEARAEAEESLRLGQDLDWDRNTAFCLKCIGRIFRMEAEQNYRDEIRFGKCLESSVDFLQRAIEMFPKVTELNEIERISEVGDCFSLLGRTYLIAGQTSRAADAAREAIDRITDHESKDFADLEILLGDLALARGDQAAAESHFDCAIQVAGTSDAERSEIAARARFQKGVLTGKSEYFDKAAEIWDRLEEPHNADRAKWQSIVANKRVPTSAASLLEGEPPSVRVEVLRLHNAALAGMPGGFRGRRSEPDRNYWKPLIAEARKAIAVRNIHW
jgi:tetratricopeptide (TPR) repeat protein